MVQFEMVFLHFDINPSQPIARHDVSQSMPKVNRVAELVFVLQVFHSHES